MKILNESNLVYYIRKFISAFVSKTETEEVESVETTPAESVEVDTTPTENSNHLITSGGVYNAIQTLAGRVDMPAETFTGESLNATVNKYYLASASVNTLAVTLPAITDVTKVQSLIIHLTVGTTPNISFTSADSRDISYYTSYAIEAGKEYEINILFNGAKWIIASAEITISTP